MPQPYIGITGFMSRKEIDECAKRRPPNSSRLLMCGVLVSSKTLAGKTNKYWNSYPKLEHLAMILAGNQPGVFKCLHLTTDEPEKLYNQAMLGIDYGGGKVDGIQLNMVWPDEKAIRRLKDQEPKLKFILQVSPHLAGYSTLSPEQLASNLSYYSGQVDYVIVDYSRGFGLDAPIDEVKKYFAALHCFHSGIGIVLGGGLFSGNVCKIINPLLTLYPDISIDTQRKTRDDSEDGGHLILPEAIAYLEEAFWTVP